MIEKRETKQETSLLNEKIQSKLGNGYEITQKKDGLHLVYDRVDWHFSEDGLDELLKLPKEQIISILFLTLLIK